MKFVQPLIFHFSNDVVHFSSSSKEWLMAGGAEKSPGYKMGTDAIFKMPESHPVCINMVTGDLCSLIMFSHIK
jgi:hypothetical protein